MNRSKSKLPVKRQRPTTSTASTIKTKVARTTSVTPSAQLHSITVTAAATGSAVPSSMKIIDGPKISNPATEAKLEAIKEKEKEVEGTNKVKNMSADMLSYFRTLTDNIKELAEDAQTVGKSLENWHHVFNMMSEMNRASDDGPKDSKIWVRYRTNIMDKAT
ncbi:hypothetical protein BDF20DRAFT_856029 [Mycotypha africana]|uniref:uncharacterized protein n=1 Tax=Mycotypha africana TaxID=64632 RepID=UPI002300921B|nr:uncharacterized protein BDF20DRAFT_856029 [Mycotypha africana]KAI8988501.1 hypothetical protein BDF20DRAFT_856029 [Mycotypha africana]